MNNLRKFYFGEYPLPFSFWVVRLPFLIMIPIIGNLMELLSSNYLVDKNFHTPEELIFYYGIHLLRVFLICSLVYVDVGTWNSSRNYNGNNFWKYFTQFLLVIDFISICFGIIFLYEWSFWKLIFPLLLVHMVMKND